MQSKAQNSESCEVVAREAETREQARFLTSTREEKIRGRAYEIYLERGGESGHDLQDWLQAERELTTKETEAAD